jgi:hypothetical protein
MAREGSLEWYPSIGFALFFVYIYSDFNIFVKDTCPLNLRKLIKRLKNFSRGRA